MQEIKPGIFVENRYPPYNLGLITLDEGGLVIDVPPNAEDAEQWLHDAEAIAGTIHYIVLTDAQPEKLLGTALLNIPVIATEEAARWTASLDEKAWQEIINEAEKRYGDTLNPRIAHHLPKIKIAFNKRMHLQRRTPTLEFEAISGAGIGSLWVLVPEAKLLFAGDSVVTDVPPILEYTPDSQAWLKALATLSRRTTVQEIVQGRGAPVIPQGEIETQREFMRIIRHTARTLAKESEPGEGMSRAATELQQAFFPNIPKHSDAMRRLQKGIAHLVAEILEAQEAKAKEENETES